MKRKLIFSLAFLLSIAIYIPVFAGGSLNVQIHHSDAEPFTDSVGYTVDVYISALDADGTPLKDLTVENFKVFQDSNIQTLKDAKPVENESMSIVLLMDVSGTMLGQPLIDTRNAASKFLERLGRNDRSAVMEFNDEITTLQSFTSDHLASSEAALQAEAENLRGTCLYDSIYAAMEMTLSEPNGRRAVIVFTDGVDETINPGERCSTKHVEDVLSFSDENKIPIYTMGIGPKTDDKDLKRIGETSGGSFIKVTNSADMDSAFSKLYSQLNNEYKLTYETDGAAGSHTIMVEAEKESAVGRDSYSINLPVMPTIMKFQAPAENAQLQGKVLLSVIFISQSSEISNVVYSCNGQVIGSSVSKPYEYLWDVSQYKPQENLFLEAVSFDKSGVEMGRTSVPVSIIDTPPELKASIEFSSPRKGEEYQGNVPIRVSVFSGSDEVGFVEYYGDGKYLGKVISSPYDYSWDISQMNSGNIDIEAIAYSKDNRELSREKVMVYVHEMPTPVPGSTEAVVPNVDLKYDSIMNQNKILLIGLGTLVIILIVLLIVIFRRKPTKDVKTESVDVFRVTPPQFGYETGNDTIDDSAPGTAINRSQGVFAVLTVKNCDDKSMIGSVVNITSLPVTLGRSADNDVVFSQYEKAVSKHHAIMEDLNGQITIRDAQSTYGTFVNEEKIGTSPVVLENGAVIRMGPRTTLIFERMFTSISGGNEDETIDAAHGTGSDDDVTRQIPRYNGDPTCRTNF